MNFLPSEFLDIVLFTCFQNSGDIGIMIKRLSTSGHEGLSTSRGTQEDVHFPAGIQPGISPCTFTVLKHLFFIAKSVLLFFFFCYFNFLEEEAQTQRG